MSFFRSSLLRKLQAPSNLLTKQNFSAQWSPLQAVNPVMAAAQVETSRARTNETSESSVTNVINHVNKQIQSPQSMSRLFAVVMIGGSQYKVTTEDIILVRNHFYPTIGDRIRLEKVLLVGGKDFTVVGKPLVSKEFVRIEATVIEKTISNDVIIFKYTPRKDNRKMNVYNGIHTMLRINSIDLIGPVPGTAQNQAK